MKIKKLTVQGFKSFVNRLEIAFPHGISGVVIIAESHLFIHTWPEYGYAAADIFTCGTSVQPEKAAELLIEKLGAKRHSIQEILRGAMVAEHATSR